MKNQGRFRSGLTKSPLRRRRDEGDAGHVALAQADRRAESGARRCAGRRTSPPRVGGYRRRRCRPLGAGSDLRPRRDEEAVAAARGLGDGEALGKGEAVERQHRAVQQPAGDRLVLLRRPEAVRPLAGLAPEELEVDAGRPASALAGDAEGAGGPASAAPAGRRTRQAGARGPRRRAAGEGPPADGLRGRAGRAPGRRRSRPGGCRVPGALERARRRCRARWRRSRRPDGKGKGVVVASSAESDPALRRLLVFVLRRRAEGTVHRRGRPCVRDAGAVASRLGRGRRGRGDGRRGGGEQRAPPAAWRRAATAPPSSAETSGGGVAFGSGLVAEHPGLEDEGPDAPPRPPRESRTR